jgi:hypothetical protein
MKTTGQTSNVYEGEIDKGWTLWVQEFPKVLIVRLNGHRIPDLAAAAQAYKKKDPKYSTPYQQPAAPTDKPTFEKDDVYCLWGFGSEPGGEIERYWNVKVWDLPDGTHFIRAEKTKGDPMPEVPSNVVEAHLDANWKNAGGLTGPDTPDLAGFLGYLLVNADHPAQNDVHY